ncbi:restriction endonuclease [Paenibacillus sp. Soil522]|uniref:restriction endonuclease n=1 Tax=Paenibacillus sp. Soil522 TaxID=1736388 RepID=UPI001F3BE677|nr:restriction endonuclease [Paenibacillus sp. Soil522]
MSLSLHRKIRQPNIRRQHNRCLIYASGRQTGAFKEIRPKGYRRKDGRQFEHYLGHLLRVHVYSVEVTRAVGDYGADLVIKKIVRRLLQLHQVERKCSRCGSNWF